MGEARRNKREGMSEEEGASRKNRMEEARRNEKIEIRMKKKKKKRKTKRSGQRRVL